MKYLYRTLYGTFVRKTKIAGYCNKHNVSITHRQLKSKNCIEKDCTYFRKVTNFEEEI